jgi:HEPN domain-containing protein
MRKDTENFITSSEYDLQTAASMFESGRYIYVVFMCHISAEKMLKAIVAEATQNIPPKTHNLIYLIKLGDVNLPPDLFEFVAKLNNASIITRYPEDFRKLLEVFPQDIAKEYLMTTQRVIEWLKSHRLQT